LQPEPIFDVRICDFEPPVIRPGTKGKSLKKEMELVKKIRDKIGSESLDHVKKACDNGLVSVMVDFYLWKGSAKVTNTRPVKDLDNLLKIVFDVLKKKPTGENEDTALGLIENDDYICELYARKSLVDEESQEGLRIKISKFEDGKMLGILRNHKRPSAP
jgi:Holliday junction resolvase RusA-like endonuclease